MKRVFLLVLVLALALSLLCACGTPAANDASGDGSGTTNGGGNSNGTTGGGTSDGGTTGGDTTGGGTTGGDTGGTEIGGIPADLAVGDIFTFGTYEQDNNEANGKEGIEWLTLDVKEGKALVISKYALDHVAYNDRYASTTWETSSLRTWLNDTFINSAFSTEEQGEILESALSNPSNPVYYTFGGNDTVDRIFLLSYEEAEMYFTTSEARVCAPTAYIAEYVSTYEGGCFWWVRTPGYLEREACGVSSTGSMDHYGNAVDLSGNGVRPAMWVEIAGGTVSDTPETPTLEIGDTLTFGAYEQDNNTSGGKEAIDWLVLDIVDGKALVISKYALDCKQYHTSYTSITWENCSLRAWLNGTFLNTAFTSEEQAKILTTTVTNPDNPSYGTDGGNNTQDKLFLLSIAEAETYFASDAARVCQSTAYAKAQGTWTSTGGNCYWRLRSPGNTGDNGALVDSTGYVSRLGGYSVYFDETAVRPAFWMSLES